MSENSPFSLAGKTVLVAGASRGIGLAIARAAAAHGARTLLASRSLPALEAESAALRDQGYQAEAWKLDFAAPDSIVELADSLPEIDALVNVAGTNVRKKFQDYTQDEYERV